MKAGKLKVKDKILVFILPVILISLASTSFSVINYQSKSL